MKLQISCSKFDGLKKIKGISAVTLHPSNSSTVIAACYDQSLLQLDIQTSKLISDPIHMDCIINALCWQPKSCHEGSLEQDEESHSYLVAASSDGSLIFLTQSRLGRQHFSLRIKKTVPAHQGSVTCVQWSFDGSNLLSAGEDGEVKVWSQIGHLKAVIARFSSCVNSLGWNYECNSVITAHDDILTIVPLQNQNQSRGGIIEWKVSSLDETCSNIILVVDWNNALDLILSGGEDCRYRVFDSTGGCLFASQPLMQPITGAVWMLSGEAFAVGSYNTIHFCDKAGLGMNYYNVEGNGSVLDLHFVEDSSQIIAGCSSGNIINANIMGRTHDWNGVVVDHAENNQLNLNFTKGYNDSSDTVEVLSFTDGPIIDFELGFEHLVVMTTTQCHVYHLYKMSSPTVMPLPGSSVITSMSSNNVALLEKKNGVLAIYSYTGRKTSSFHLKGMSRTSKLKDFITISTKHLGLVEPSDDKVIRIYKCSQQSNISGAVLEHEFAILCIRICPLELLPDQSSENLAILDRNKDVSIVSFDLDRLQGQFSKIYKIGMQMNSISWNETCNVLVSSSDWMLNIYHYPDVPFIDIDLLPDTIEKLHLEKCEGATISSACGASIVMKKNNKTNHEFLMNQDPSTFFQNAKVLNWKECYRYCRYADATYYWTSLACLAMKHDNLEIAELALAETKKVDKVNMIKHLRELPDGERKLAEKHLYRRNVDQAIAILLQCSPPDYYRAIKTQVYLCLWVDALETAEESKEDGYIDIVLWYRSCYLRQMKKVETNPRFINLTKKRSIISKERLSQLKSILRKS